MLSSALLRDLPASKRGSVLQDHQSGKLTPALVSRIFMGFHYLGRTEWIIGHMVELRVRPHSLSYRSKLVCASKPVITWLALAAAWPAPALSLWALQESHRYGELSRVFLSLGKFQGPGGYLPESRTKVIPFSGGQVPYSTNGLSSFFFLVFLM